MNRINEALSLGSLVGSKLVSHDLAAIRALISELNRGNLLSWAKDLLSVVPGPDMTNATCHSVFTAGIPAIHCFECSVDESCAVCLSCWNAEDHFGHEYRMSIPGDGICDCGNPNAWKGACSSHSQSSLLTLRAKDSVAKRTRNTCRNLEFDGTSPAAWILRWVFEQFCSMIDDGIPEGILEWIVTECRGDACRSIANAKLGNDSALSKLLAVLSTTPDEAFDMAVSALLTSTLSYALDDLRCSITVLYKSFRTNESTNFAYRALEILTVELFAASNPTLILESRIQETIIDVLTTRMEATVLLGSSSYIKLFTDLLYTLNNTSSCDSFVNDPVCMGRFVNFVGRIQQEYSVLRETEKHVEIENSKYIRVLNLEISILKVFNTLRVHCSPSVVSVIVRLLDSKLGEYSLPHRPIAGGDVGENRVSIHTPLTRAMAMFLPSSILTLECVTIACAFEFPLQCIAVAAQCRAGYWIRNGEFSTRFPKIYFGSEFPGNRADMYYLQCSLGYTSPSNFLDIAISMFGIRDVFKHPEKTSTSATLLMDEFVVFLADILFGRNIHHGLSTTTYVKSELIAMLASSRNMGYNDLVKYLPSSSTSQASAILRHIGHFTPPRGTSLGSYRLKKDTWTRVNPLQMRFSEAERAFMNEFAPKVTAESKSLSPELFGKNDSIIGIGLKRLLISDRLFNLVICMLRMNLSRPSFSDIQVLGCTTIITVAVDNFGQLETHHKESLRDIQVLLASFSQKLVNLSYFSSSAIDRFHTTVNAILGEQNPKAPLGKPIISSKKRKSIDRQTKIVQEFKKRRHVFNKNSGIAEPSHYTDSDICCLCNEKSDDYVGLIGFISTSRTIEVVRKGTITSHEALLMKHRGDPEFLPDSPKLSQLTSKAFIPPSVTRRATGESTPSQQPVDLQASLQESIQNILRQNGNNLALGPIQGLGGLNMDADPQQLSQMFADLIRQHTGAGLVPGGMLESVETMSMSEKQTPIETDFEWRSNCLNIQSCGHYIHSKCLQSYLQSRKNRETFQCVVCRRLSNIFVPVPADAADTSRNADIIGSFFVTLNEFTNQKPIPDHMYHKSVKVLLSCIGQLCRILEICSRSLENSTIQTANRNLLVLLCSIFKVCCDSEYKIRVSVQLAELLDSKEEYSLLNRDMFGCVTEYIGSVSNYIECSGYIIVFALLEIVKCIVHTVFLMKPYKVITDDSNDTALEKLFRRIAANYSSSLSSGHAENYPSSGELSRSYSSLIWSKFNPFRRSVTLLIQSIFENFDFNGILPSTEEDLDNFVRRAMDSEFASGMVDKYLTQHFSTPSSLEWSTSQEFRLHPLPYAFEDLYSKYLHSECFNCSLSCTVPLVCLVCGRTVCGLSSKSMQCGLSHVDTCSGPTGILFNISQCEVLLISKLNGCATWGSIYLSEHGEEDSLMKHGLPLTLDMSRYNMVKNLYLSGGFEDFIRRQTRDSLPDFMAQ